MIFWAGLVRQASKKVRYLPTVGILIQLVRKLGLPDSPGAQQKLRKPHPLLYNLGGNRHGSRLPQMEESEIQSLGFLPTHTAR